MLSLTDRTVRRQLERLREDGPGFLQHGLKGRRSGNRLSSKEEQKIKMLLQTKYPDFGPAFAAEKLLEIHGLDLDPKTIRRLQVNLGLFIPRRARRKVVHRYWRLRRAIYGELVQFDGSYHNWFEGRGGLTKDCLLLAVDDATGNILDAQFAPHEGVLPVMGFWLSYAHIHGLPKAIYLDRFSTYSMNVKLAAENPDTLTQFERGGSRGGHGGHSRLQSPGQRTSGKYLRHAPGPFSQRDAPAKHQNRCRGECFPAPYFHPIL